MNTVETVTVNLDPELSARFTSVITHNPEVAVAVSALMTDAVKFVLGDINRLEAEAANQSFVETVQDLQVPCGDCLGWGTFQLDPDGERHACEECSGRGWKWAE